MPSVAECVAAIVAERAAAAARANAPAARKAFRSSIAWRRTRYAVLAENATRNGGTARCELCGVASAPGRPLHVDHIEPISRNFARRLDRTNLRVLCADCNVGKMDGPALDLAEPSA